MFTIGNEIFVHFATESQRRVLHPATIIGTDDGRLTAEFEESDICAEADQLVLIFYDVRQIFVQQPARIESVVDNESKHVVTIETTGDASSAGHREFYRVSTVMSDLRVNVDSEGVHELLDVSATGLSIVAREAYGIGQILEIQLLVDEEEFRGSASVRSISKLQGDRTRYGLICITDDESGCKLRDGLRRLSTTLERKQLKRLSGIA